MLYSKTILLLHLSSFLLDAFNFSSDDCMEYDYVVNTFAEAKDASDSTCFRGVPISFESCRYLLANSVNCDTMAFRNKVCSLADSSSPHYHEVRGIANSVVVRKNFRNADKCATARNYIPSVHRFQQCVANAVSSPIFTNNLPLLGIVVSVTSEWANNHQAGVAAMRSNLECYCAVHNYHFELNVMPPMTAAQFFYERHQYVRHRYLSRYQYVLHLDADSLVLNLSMPLEPYFLGNSKDHVHLHMHENGEVTAAAYLVKNSAESRCFLQLWADFSPPHRGLIEGSPTELHLPAHDLDRMTYEVSNYDNGDLVAAMTNLLGPKIYKTCLNDLSVRSPQYFQRLRNAYHETIVECFKRMHATLGGRLRMHAPFIRIYLPREGFWRTHARTGRFGLWWDKLFGSCYGSSDIIGHGWKAMPRQMWGVPVDSPVYDKSFAGPTPVCDIATIRAGNGANANCVWLSLLEEKELARRFCMYRSPVCMMNSTCIEGESGSRSGNTREADNRNRNGKGRRHVRQQRKGRVDSRRALRSAQCNSCLRKDSSCALQRVVESDNWVRATKSQPRHAKSALSSFGVENEAWWREQMCSACPFIKTADSLSR